MIEPALALSLATAAGAIAVLLFWPVRGLVWRAARIVRSGDRVRIEDALKHFYDCEYRGTQGTLLSLAGALGLSGDRTAELISRLEALGLVAAAKGGYRLTAAGRSDALRVIRLHRLWERYLSEETGLDPTEWHAAADEREHRMSAQEADDLAARMGDPRFDPHGDPIPTVDGDLPPPRGKALAELSPGEAAEIVHVEDEPETVYAQLVALGLHPGLRVRMIEVSPRRIRFEAGGEEHVLAPVHAANLSVVALVAEEIEGGPFESLADLAPGETATVSDISVLCRGRERRRLLDLGIVPGTHVEAALTSPSGDPAAYRVRGALLALRREQANLIHVHREGHQPSEVSP
jgi:DtxR family Mn-dependent transcriptional regulator